VKSLTWSPDDSGIACAGDGGVYYLQLKVSAITELSGEGAVAIT
jgi:hypothetical protein